MTRWGVRSTYGDLGGAIVHRPGAELDLVTPETLDMFHFERPVDRAVFVAGYDRMLEALGAGHAELHQLRDVLSADTEALAYLDRRPNMTYTRDLATVFRRGAVLMGPRLLGRQGDQEMLARAFRRLGIPILGRIDPPGFLEGGGVTMLGEDTVVAALCDRANEAGTAALRELVLGRDVRAFLEVPLPPGRIHIDGDFMVVDERLCLIHEPTFRDVVCRLFEAGRREPRCLAFFEVLDERGFARIPITETERLGAHLNVVVTRRGRCVVAPAQATRVVAELERRGWGVSTFPSAEMAAGNGGVHCMTCPVLVQ
jgi:N-dimethylarginine dimethylaminohydrolase